MSLITRCTACQTLFKVVPDQLRISDGWVRCGQCGEIFDAAQNLLIASEEPDAATPIAEDTILRDKAVNRLPQADPAAVAPAPEPAIEAVLTLPPEPVESVQVLATPTDTVADVSPARPETPSFMQGDAVPSAWQRRGVRRALATAALVLIAALAVQILRHERDRIAAVEPALRPVLAALCQSTGCVISPMRQIESVVIDSSSFSRLRGDVYRLAFSLRNSAAVDIAMPAIELSVTDAQDQALSRRVLLPAEFGATSLVLPAGGEWGSKLSLNVKSGGAERIAGYRLLAFYP